MSAPTPTPLLLPPEAGGGWAHRLALATAGATMLLIFVGGLVTGLGAGLAVPDWPTTFGYNMFLFPWAKMIGGIFYEHSHRLLGSLVGTLTILTAGALWFGRAERPMRWLGVLALLLVIAQGVLGGLRVVLVKNTLAIIHACAAQLFFALMVGIAFSTSKSWSRARVGRLGGEAKNLFRLALASLAVLYLQTIFGSILRHTGARLDAHLLFAALAAVLVFRLSTRLLRAPGGDDETLARPAQALGLLLLLQLVLGLGAYLVKYTVVGDAVSPWTIVLLTSAHVLTGALLFAAGMALALRLYREQTFLGETGDGALLAERARA